MAVQRYCLGLIGCLLVGSAVVVIVSVSRTRSSEVNRVARQTTGTDLSVQLVGGQYPWEGRVFVRTPGGKYGGMCSSYLTTADLTVICKSVFTNQAVTGAVSPVTSFGGSAENTIVSNTLRCTGAETNIGQCPGATTVTWTSKSLCVRGEAAVNCQGNTPVRLAGGGTKTYMGRLEVSINSTWGSVCNRGFDSKAARVVCDKLGFWNTAATVTSASAYGAATGAVKMENLTCSGTEPDLAFCFWDSPNCTHTTDVGINCQQVNLPSTYIRLTDGLQPWQGRVEVLETYFRHRWTSVCSRSWTTSNTKVACLNLGYKYGGSTLSPMQEGVTKAVIDRFACKGTEANLGLCPGYFKKHSYECGTNPPTTAAIDCSGGVLVRLVGGTRPMEGRVEIFSGGKWATVSSAQVQVEEAVALCGSLGYQTTHPQVLAPNTFGKGATTIISSLACATNRQHISQCTIGTPTVSAALTQAAIRCFNCSSTYTQETGTILSPGYPNSASENTDCLYHISPKGTAPLYKMTITNLLLGFNDVIEVKESPLTAAVGLYKGANHHPDMYLFKKDLYIRFKTGCCGPRHFVIRWEPITIESTVRLTCTDVYMDVKVNITELKWLYADTNPAYISLINEGCTGSYLGDNWQINNPHSQCFTNRLVDANRVTYKNALIYKEIGSGPIVREHRWRVDLECAFTRDVKVNQQYNVENQYNYQNNLTSVYQAEIHMYNDSTLTNEMSYEPIKAKLGDDLYVKVSLKGNWNVTMRLQGCVGKPAPNSTISYALIHNGCSTDTETHVVYEDRANTLFHFKAFEFYAGFSTVYLSCDVKFCTPGDLSSACNWKCSTVTGKRDTSNSLTQRMGTSGSSHKDFSVSKRLEISQKK